MEFKRFENESDEELLLRLGDQKDLIGTWEDVAKIMNELTGSDFGESTYRKKYTVFQKMMNANKSRYSSTEEKNAEIQELTRKFEREKIKFRDERNAWQRQNFADARVEQKLDYLEDQLSSIGRVNFNDYTPVKRNSDNDLLVILSDFHIGATFKSNFGEYNTDIAKRRLAQLLKEIEKIKETHNSEKCYVVLAGDMISGSIHHTIQVTNRENVIEQIKIATELIGSFCYELSGMFSTVFMSDVTGNHSRMTRKEDAIHDERLDLIVSWGVGLMLGHVENFHVLHRNLDTGIADLYIRGKTFIVSHGDNDAFSRSGVQKLVMMLGFVPDYVVMGHMHTCALDEVNGVKMIRGGCLCGSGDQYTVEKRLLGKASQMVCVCNDKGVNCYYPIELD